MAIARVVGFLAPVTDVDRPELDGKERPLLDEIEPPSLVGVGSGAVDMVD